MEDKTALSGDLFAELSATFLMDGSAGLSKELSAELLAAWSAELLARASVGPSVGLSMVMPD